jgi:hypothetical protein
MTDFCAPPPPQPAIATARPTHKNSLELVAKTGAKRIERRFLEVDENQLKG